MTNQKKGLGRRRFLRGVGTVAVALPFLESLGGNRSMAGPVEPLRRFVYYHTSNGIDVRRYWPGSAYGAISGSTLSGTALEPLADHASQLLLLRGVHAAPARSYSHQLGTATKLTAAPIVMRDGTEPGISDEAAIDASGASTISLDQRIAQELDGREAFGLRLGGQTNTTMIKRGFSYAGANDMRLGEQNPWTAYRRVMSIAPDDGEVMDRITTRRQSVLDLVYEEYSALPLERMSADDRRKLDLHFSNIRDLETGLAGAGLVSCGALDPAIAAAMADHDASLDSDHEWTTWNTNYREVGDWHMDVLAIAVACGYSRAATIQWDSSAYGPIYRWDGLSHTDSHHALSHGETGGDGAVIAGAIDRMHEIDRWHAARFASLLDRLAAYSEGDGTVLDHSVVVWSNELSDGMEHSMNDVPWVLAGSCGGRLRTGRYLKLTRDDHDTVMESAFTPPFREQPFAKDAPHCKLLTTIANAVGLRESDGGPIERIGSGFETQPGQFDDLLA